MNVSRFFKLKKLNGELDDCSDKELFLIGFFEGVSAELDIDYPIVNNRVRYRIVFGHKDGSNVMSSSQRHKMFGCIFSDIYFEFDLKFYGGSLCDDRSLEYWNYSSIYDESYISCEVNKLYTSLDKKFRISQNIFKYYGLGH